MIKVEEIYATNNEKLQKDLNDLEAERIISVEYRGDDYYRVIYTT